MATTDTPRRAPGHDGRPADPATGTVGLGTWFGFPVRAHWTAAITVAILTELLGVDVLPHTGSANAQRWTWIAAFVTAAVFLLTVMLHELAHAVVARRRGVRVNRITLWMLGGVTELVDDPTSPRDEAMVALSGPLTSIGIGIVCGAAAILIDNPLARSGAAWLAFVSVLIGVFNLLPGTPLDGGRVLRAVLWARTGDKQAALRSEAVAGRRLGTGLIALGLLVFVLTWSVAGLWLGLIGFYMRSSAGAQGRAGVMSALHGLCARDAMVPCPPAVPGWWSVEQVIGELRPDQTRAPAIPIVDLSGAVVDAVTVPELLDVPVSRRADTRLSDLSRHVRALVVSPSTSLVEVSERLRGTGATAIVVEGHEPVGLITVGALVRLAQVAQLRATDADARGSAAHWPRFTAP